jgi:hypothetical protein
MEFSCVASPEAELVEKGNNLILCDFLEKMKKILNPQRLINVSIYQV